MALPGQCYNKSSSHCTAHHRSALASAPGTEVKVFATALGVGILIDATIVRALLVPALVSVLGRWNWWLPDRLARFLRVRPSHAIREQPVPELARVD